MLILLLNDDGYKSTLTAELKEYLKRLGHEIYCFLPYNDSSGVSCGISTNKEIHYRKISEKEFIVYGTPCDCAILGVHYIKQLKKKIDLVISGLNEGSNLGPAIRYSGTVSAAKEVLEYNIPCIAISKFKTLDKYLVEDKLYVLESVINYMYKKGYHRKRAFGVNINFVNGEFFKCDLEKKYVHYKVPLYYPQFTDDFAKLKLTKTSRFKECQINASILLDGIKSENAVSTRINITKQMKTLKKIINAQIEDKRHKEPF